jgi:hypothetical protein
MNALPSFEPPKHSPQRRKATALRQPHHPKVAPTAHPSSHPQKRSRVKSNSVYAHRRQGLEAIAKVVTYSSLSLFGLVTLIQSIGYNCSQHGKLQYLETALKDTQQRSEKVKGNFTRSFDPESQQSVMEENTYKVAPDRLQILIVNHPADRPAPKTPQSKK